MTEQEWLSSRHPTAMLSGRTVRISDRKARLFAVACCRRMWADISLTNRESAAVAERYADGLVTNAEFVAVASVSYQATYRTSHQGAANRWAANQAANWATHARAAYAADRVANEATNWAANAVDVESRSLDTLAASREAERLAQADLLRDIVGNPFRPVTNRAEYRECCGKRWLNAAGPQYCTKCGDLAGCGVLLHPWISRLVLDIASEAYSLRHEDGTLDNHRLAVLSDALEEAGCAEQSLLSNLRSPGVHYRGMWSLDCVLGKE